MIEIKFNEIVSPEGVEERVIEEFVFRITMTGGGKFRLYLPVGDGRIDATQIYDDEEKAKKEIGGAMMMFGGLLHSPKEVTGMLIKSLKRQTGKDRKE